MGWVINLENLEWISSTCIKSTTLELRWKKLSEIKNAIKLHACHLMQVIRGTKRRSVKTPHKVRSICSLTPILVFWGKEKGPPAPSNHPGPNSWRYIIGIRALGQVSILSDSVPISSIRTLFHLALFRRPISLIKEIKDLDHLHARLGL